MNIRKRFSFWIILASAVVLLISVLASPIRVPATTSPAHRHCLRQNFAPIPSYLARRREMIDLGYVHRTKVILSENETQKIIGAASSMVCPLDLPAFSFPAHAEVMAETGPIRPCHPLRC